MKKIHPNWGEVEVLADNGDGTSLVQLASGEKRTVTTDWLTVPNGPAEPKPA